MITLKADNPIQQRILDYLNANASEVLTAKINAGDKTLKGALNYAKDEARKMADGESCIAVDDATVFGWIIHFFEEDSIKEKKTVRTVATPEKKPEKKVVAPKPKAKPEAQLDMFSALMQFNQKIKS